MEHILNSHLIDPKALHSNDFDAFFTAREVALLDRIEHAMGKPIARERAVPEAALSASFEDVESLEEVWGDSNPSPTSAD